MDSDDELNMDDEHVHVRQAAAAQRGGRSSQTGPLDELKRAVGPKLADNPPLEPYESIFDDFHDIVLPAQVGSKILHIETEHV